MKYFIVDAFTEVAFCGNPAAVVIVDDDVKSDIMQKLAFEFNYSETAFVKKINQNYFEVRYFTPTDEVELCGHATIASVKVLYEHNLINDSVKIKTLAGDIYCDIDEKQNIFIDMAAAEILKEKFEDEKIKEIYNIIGLDYSESEITDYEFTPKIVTTGLKDIMVPVKSYEDLNNIIPKLDKMIDFSKEEEVVGMHAFYYDINDDIIYVRNFAPLYGIDEEAATGTSNGALTYYLYKFNIIKNGKLNKFIQGEKINRPSKIVTKLILDENKSINIRVGGKAVILTSGEISKKLFKNT